MIERILEFKSIRRTQKTYAVKTLQKLYIVTLQTLRLGAKQFLVVDLVQERVSDVNKF